MNDLLMSALLGSQQSDYRSDPYMQGARAIQSIDPMEYKMKPGQRLLAGLLSGLGGGVLNSIGENRVNAKTQARNDSILDGLRTGKVVEALSSDPELAGIAPLYSMQQDQAKAAQQQELNKVLLPQGLMLNPDDPTKPIQLFDPAQEKARAAGLSKAAEIEATINAYGNSPAGDFSSKISSPTKKGLFGEYDSTKSKRDTLIQEAMSRGLTPNAAADYAREELTLGKSLSKGAIAKIEEARKKADTLESIAAQARAGVEGAGETGGLLNGPRNLLSMAYSIISPEERQQRSSQALLDSLKPQILGVSRTPGSGATSDLESKALLGAGPSSDKTPQENLVLIENIKNTAAIQREYADFLEAYIQDKGDAIGADRAWQQYKASNPLFASDETGALKPNTGRQPWEEFFSGRGSNQAINEVPQEQQQQTQISDVQMRTLKDGRKVQVRSLGNGQYEVVE